MVQKMILVMIAVLVGVQLAESIQTSIATSTGVGGVFESTPAGSILALIPLVFVVGILVFALILSNKSGK